MELDRRDFLKGAAVTSAIAAVGLVGCGSGGSSGTGSNATAESAETEVVSLQIMPGDESALGTPPEIAEADVAETISVDVLVVGAGITGVAAVRSAAEEGAKVLCIEKKEGLAIHGFQAACVNSSFGRNLGVEIDPKEVLNEYQRRSVGRANMAVATLWANHSGETMDWYMEPIVGDQAMMDYVTVAYYPLRPEHDPSKDLTKTFVGSLDFKEDPSSPIGSPCWMELGARNKTLAEKAGAEYRFLTAVVRLITDDTGKVIGAYAKDAEGKYIKIETSKGVILASGGSAQFGAGSELIHKVYAPSSYKNYMLQVGEEPAWEEMFQINPGAIGGATGDGQLMALWAGAYMDAYCDTAMGSAESGIGGTVALTVNQNGERFFNEDIGIWEKHDQLMNQPGYCSYDIIDVNWRDRLPFQALGHRNFNYNDVPVAVGWNGIDYVNNFHKEFLAAIGKPDGIVPTLDPHAGTVYAAETLEELAEIIKVPTDTFLASIARYNEICAAGVDEDFGCDSQKLFPIETGPFFACMATARAAMAAYAGVITNGKLEVLSKATGKPIGGLWAAGNVNGSKFSPSYSTLMSGMNHGNGVCHGYFAGKWAAKA
ncbi:MAG: FAD-binding protein [Actinobacteria bacterium]|nr:FAD-binding protein [Actinomycetota bacterium]